MTRNSTSSREEVLCFEADLTALTFQDNFMKRDYWVLFTLCLALGGCAGNGSKSASTPASSKPHSGVGTLVIKPITFKNDAYIRDAVKEECNLDGKLTEFINEYAAPQYASIVAAEASGDTGAQVLTIEIESVQGSAGGAWSGAKDVVITGSLSQNGKELGDFKARRYSGGGMFAGYKGTCAILGRCVKTLGKDVSEWLAHPTPHAMLGDL